MSMIAEKLRSNDSIPKLFEEMRVIGSAESRIQSALKGLQSADIPAQLSEQHIPSSYYEGFLQDPVHLELPD